MDLVTFAVIIGIIELVIGIPLVVHPKEAAAWLNKVIKDDIEVRVTGVIFVVLGGLVLSSQYTITDNLAGFVVLVAWICTVKGLFLAWHPAWAVAEKSRWLQDERKALFSGVAECAIGVLMLTVATML